MARLVNTVSPVLDGEAVVIGDGVTRNRALRIPAGAYPTPLWVRTGGGLFVRVDSLPWQGVVRTGSVDIRSAASPPVQQSRLISAEHLEAVVNSRAVTAEQVASVLRTSGVAAEHEFGGTPPTDHPNEPSGMTALGENNLSAIPGSGWTLGGGSRYSIVTSGYAGTAPVSPTSVLQYRLPPLAVSGSGNDQITLSFDRRVVYVHYHVQIGDNWFGDSSGVNKMAWMLDQADPAAGGGDPFILNAGGIGTNPLRLQVMQQGPAGASRLRYDSATGVYSAIANDADPTASQATLTRGAWHDLEFVFTANTPGSANGRVEAWLNSIKILDYSGLEMLTPTSSGEFDHFKIYPIWGGNSGTSPAAAQFMWFDHAYVSGKD